MKKLYGLIVGIFLLVLFQGCAQQLDIESSVLLGSRYTVFTNELSQGPFTISFSNYSNYQFVQGTITVNGTSSSTNGTILATEYKIDDEASWHDTVNHTDWSISWNTDSYEEGTNQIFVRSTDVDLITCTNYLTLIVDRTAPTVTVTTPVYSTSYQDTVVFHGTASDNLGLKSLQMSIDGVGWKDLELSSSNTWSTNFFTGNYVDASHTFRIKAEDYIGHVTTNTVQFTIYNWSYYSISGGYNIFDMYCGGPGAFMLYGCNSVYQGSLYNFSTTAFMYTSGVQSGNTIGAFDYYGGKYNYLYYYYSGATHYIRLKYNNGSLTTNLLVGANTNMMFRKVDIANSSSGYPSLAYTVGAAGSRYITYGFYTPLMSGVHLTNNRYFFYETASDDFGGEVSLDIDSSNDVHIAYINYSDPALYIVRLRNTSTGVQRMSKYTIDSVTPDTVDLKIVSNTIYVVYGGSFGLKYSISTNRGNSFSDPVTITTDEISMVTINRVSDFDFDFNVTYVLDNGSARFVQVGATPVIYKVANSSMKSIMNGMTSAGDTYVFQIDSSGYIYMLKLR